jgi:hypothetical protein
MNVSILDYCYAAWGNLPTTKYNRIDSIICRAAKLILPNHKCNTSQKLEIFKKVNWLSAAELYEYYVLQFINKNILNPSSLTRSWTEFFVKICPFVQVLSISTFFLLLQSGSLQWNDTNRIWFLAIVLNLTTKLSLFARCWCFTVHDIHELRWGCWNDWSSSSSNQFV